MKTKNSSFGKAFLSKKRFALVEIAVVLFSVFLVALPGMGIAADQTTQEANATTITTSSEDDYVLGVYGNANEDDTIDMRDLTYVKLIFFGKKPETELADAKYDGKINPLDFIQIKLIIVGKEKELTVIDGADRIVTVKKSVEKIVVFGTSTLETLRSLKLERSKIIGVHNSVIKENIYFPEFNDAENVGSMKSPDYEKVLGLQPDVVIMYATFSKSNADAIQSKIESANPSITVIRFDCHKPETYVEEVKKLGYILEKEEEADEFILFYRGCLDKIKERIEELSEEDKPRVYFEHWSAYKSCAKGHSLHQKVEMAGGNNIFANEPVLLPVVDPEAILIQDPEIVVKFVGAGVCKFGGYIDDDPSRIIELRKTLKNRAGWDRISATKEGKIYMISYDILGGTRYIIGVTYMAKWFHPNLFEDVNPEATHREYLTRFQGLDYDLDEHGVFAYPPIEIDDGLAGIPDRYKGQI